MGMRAKGSAGGCDRADRAAHGNADEEVAAAADGGTEAVSLAADHDGERASEVGLAHGQGGGLLGPDDPEAADVKVGEGAGEVIERTEEEMLGRARRRLDGGGAERRLAFGR